MRREGAVAGGNVHPVRPNRMLQRSFLRPLNVDTGTLTLGLNIAPTHVGRVVHREHNVATSATLHLTGCFNNDTRF